MIPPYPITGLILAGGASKRMGRPKAHLELDGRTILERVRAVLAPKVSRLLVVTNQPTDYLDVDLEIARDLVPGQGPLGGLATGLFYTRTDWALLLACDLPFVRPEVVDYLARTALEKTAGARALIPYHAKGWEPLLAAYGRGCYPAARRLLRSGGSLLDLRDAGVRVQAVDEETLRGLDPDLESFINLNTPEDLARAQERLGA